MTMIYELRTYVDDQGRQITGKWPYDSRPPYVPIFTASCVLQFTLNGQPAQFPFVIEMTGARTPAEAFEMFPLAFEQGKAKAEADLKAQVAAQNLAAQKARLLDGIANGVPNKEGNYRGHR